MLHVDGGDDVDSRREQFLHILPALRVARAWCVGVGQLVDQCDCGPAGEHGIEIHLCERRIAVADLHAWDDLELANLLPGLSALVVLDVADDHVAAAFCSAAAFVEHRVGLADARRRAQVDAQGSACHAHSLPGVREPGVKTV